MPKVKISEYSTVNSNNTDINSINIDEGCAPSGINNAIREVMVHLKNWQTNASGDGATFASLVVQGTGSFTGAVTMSAGATLSGTNTLSGSTVMAASAGTSASPSIYFSGDTNTGIFSPAADTIAFAEGGAEAMRIDSSGNVGIGTSSPGQKLQVVDTNYNFSLRNDEASYVYLTSKGISGTTYGGFVFKGIRTSDGAEIERARITSAGNFNIKGDFLLDSSGPQIKWTSDALRFYSEAAATERMRIDSSGNVGIGQTSPSSYDPVARNLVIGNASGNTGLTISSGSANSGWILFADGTTGTAPYVGYIEYSHSTNSMRFITDAGERVRITSGGFFKQSNTGSYNDATNTFNEFNSDVSNNPCVTIRSTNASYAANSEEILPTRSATSSYSFYVAASGAGTDIEFKLRGDGNGYADGTWNNNGADYAEFFESVNGQALTLGATVVLDGNKVREATSQDPASAIIGVVRPKEPSKASMVIGNTAWNKWANKYLTDDFDRYIMEDHDVVEWEEQVLEREAVAAVEAVVDEEGNEVSPAVPAQEAVYKTKQHSYESHNIPAGVTVPADAVRKTHDDKGNKFQHYKLNPAWDKDAEYVNRENRPEWNIIGLLGQVKILKGQPVGDRWIKMRDVSATVEEWMIR